MQRWLQANYAKTGMCARIPISTLGNGFFSKIEKNLRKNLEKIYPKIWKKNTQKFGKKKFTQKNSKYSWKYYEKFSADKEINLIKKKIILITQSHGEKILKIFSIFS